MFIGVSTWLYLSKISVIIFGTCLFIPKFRIVSKSKNLDLYDKARRQL